MFGIWKVHCSAFCIWDQGLRVCHVGFGVWGGVTRDLASLARGSLGQDLGFRIQAGVGTQESTHELSQIRDS